jgi:MGT family glycosyltransferase
VNDDYFDACGLNGSNLPLAALTLLTTAHDLLPSLIDLVKREQPQYLLFDSVCPWGYLLAQIMRLPGVSSMSLMFPTVAEWFTPSGIRALVSALTNGLPHIRPYNRVAQAIAKQYALQPMTINQVFIPLPDLVISYTSALFQPGADKLSSRIKFVGPSLEARLEDDDFPYEALDARPLIYISLGSVMNQNLGFFKACLAAFGNSTKYQVVMSVGQKINLDDLGAIPENFTVRRYVPQLKLLERAKLFITHGGMNSVQEGLYYRVPLLVVPQQDEQALIARRVQQLGAGLQLMNPNTPLDPSHVRYHAERILNNKTYRQQAGRIGESLRAAGGHRRAADEILKLIQLDSPVIA